MTTPTIHENQPVQRFGTSVDEAQAAVIMIHGRGGGTQSITPLANHINGDVEGVAYLAPSAQGLTWYPNRFIAKRASNEPNLSSALNTVGNLVSELNDAGIPNAKIMILGFSQGACLAVEYAARNPQRYGGVVALSGGLIGAEGELEGYAGSLDDTPVFIGCSDVDFHIPVERVYESTEILTKLGAKVDERIYEGMGHTVNQDEVEVVRAMLANLV